VTFLEFNRRFPTEEAAIDYFYRARYDGTLVCPHCGEKIRVYRLKGNPKVFHCKNCNDSFSPFKGTIFEKSSTDMRKWFYAIHLTLNARKGISACHLQRETGVTYKTAWRMLHKIREAMGNVDMKGAFQAFVEIDEMYVGGRPRRENAKTDKTGKIVPPTPKATGKIGRGTDKTPIVGIKERSTTHVYAKIALPNAAGQRLSGKQLLSIIEEVCQEGTTVASDDFKGYRILNHNEKYVHVTVNHSLGQFAAPGGVNTNGIENFWSVARRQYVGVNHHWSVKYMQRYMDEICFRQNNRKNPMAFDTLLGQTVLRLHY
jgi:transposase-like protein